jgi:nucleotide-binding universal stress UspA family protein
MLPFRKVLCPTDFSESSDVGIAAGLEMATHFGATVRVVHVVPALPAPSPDRDYTFRVPEYEAELHATAKARLEELSERLRTRGATVEFSIGNGDAGREITRLAEECGADLIVIATHGETGWRHVLFGSVAEKVVRHATCPVLTVRPPKE